MAKKSKQEPTWGRMLRAAETMEELSAIVANMKPEERHAMQPVIKQASDRIKGS